MIQFFNWLLSMGSCGRPHLALYRLAAQGFEFVAECRGTSAVNRLKILKRTILRPFKPLEGPIRCEMWPPQRIPRQHLGSALGRDFGGPRQDCSGTETPDQINHNSVHPLKTIWLFLACPKLL